MTSERFQEIVLGVTALLWGVALLLPSAGSGTRFTQLIRFLPDWAWAALLIVCGATMLAVLPPRWRKEAHAAAGIVWVLVVLVLVRISPNATALLLALPYVALALLHFFRYLQLSQMAKL